MRVSGHHGALIWRKASAAAAAAAVAAAAALPPLLHAAASRRPLFPWPQMPRAIAALASKELQADKLYATNADSTAAIVMVSVAPPPRA